MWLRSRNKKINESVPATDKPPADHLTYKQIKTVWEVGTIHRVINATAQWTKGSEQRTPGKVGN